MGWILLAWDRMKRRKQELSFFTKGPKIPDCIFEGE
jgi:hypothetical protein